MWTVEIDASAVSEIKALPDDLKAGLVQVIELIETEGPQDCHPNSCGILKESSGR
jgi:hypothetical protein